jgi:hypothetical protein
MLQNFALGRKLLLSFRVELQPKGGLGFHGLSRLSQVSNDHIAPLFLQQLLVFQQHDNELASLLDQLQFVFELFGIHRMGQLEIMRVQFLQPLQQVGVVAQIL